jgi:hypothetical protein
MGIDTVEWPGDLKRAQALFDRMPDEIAGMRVKRPRFYGVATGVVYGPGDRGITAWVQGPEKELEDPQANLAVMFGMQMACKKGTYTGTAAQSRWGGGPDIDRKGKSGSEDGLWWFACTFRAGEQNVPGHAVGWVSGDLAWLVAAPDQESARLTVEAMAEAAG